MKLQMRIQRSIAEQRAQFVGMALARRAKYRANGLTFSFDAMEVYAMALARGEQPPKPSDGSKSMVSSTLRFTLFEPMRA